MTDQGHPGSPTETVGILTRDDGATIAHVRLAGKNPGVVFLHGFHSDMTGNKALAVEEFCRKRGQAFVRYDATGHGRSSGEFINGGIGQWAADAVSVIDALTDGPQILVGSSMGGWLMLLAALQRRHRVVGLLGLAAAPDFTEELIYAVLTPEQKRALLVEGKLEIADCEDRPAYQIGRALIEEGRENMLLSDGINLTCPVRLIHGQKDAEVPWQTVLRLQEHLASDDVEVTLIKSAGHRLGEPQELNTIVTVLEELLRKVEENR